MKTILEDFTASARIAACLTLFTPGASHVAPAAACLQPRAGGSADLAAPAAAPPADRRRLRADRDDGAKRLVSPPTHGAVMEPTDLRAQLG